MSNDKPCCKNCSNKKTTSFAVGSPVYCEVKEQRVSLDDLCPWYDPKKKAK